MFLYLLLLLLCEEAGRNNHAPRLQSRVGVNEIERNLVQIKKKSREGSYWLLLRKYIDYL